MFQNSIFTSFQKLLVRQALQLLSACNVLSAFSLEIRHFIIIKAVLFQGVEGNTVYTYFCKLSWALASFRPVSFL